MKVFTLTILLLFSAVCFSQQQNTSITLHTEEGTKKIPAYLREGMVYIPVRILADAYGIKNKTGEEWVELLGDISSLKISLKNPFYIVNDQKGKTIRVYQIPTNTYFLSDEIYIPLEYSIELLNEILGTTFKYDEQYKVLGVTPKKETPVVERSTYDIHSVTIDEKANGTLIKISSVVNIEDYKSSYDEEILSIKLKGVNANPAILDNISFTGMVKKLEVKNYPGYTEFLFLVGEEYSASEIIRIGDSNDLLVTIHNKIFAGKDANPLKDRWDFDVIVIDAGHGGRDAGAIGINGVQEKKINLAIALKLGKLIEENLPGIKVEYTRQTDTFVELYKRGRIANEKNGKLFISIHCNSTASKKSNASGFEVYLLRPGRTQEAIGIAERENSVIQYEDDPRRYQQLTDENFILVSMAHSTYMKYSEKFSEYLDKHFSDDFGLSSRGVKQAGFFVLVGASMPSVLIEAGFLSNKTDAAFLSSVKGQEQTAELIFESIKSFKGYYESFLGAK